jgi:hypothetical protein
LMDGNGFFGVSWVGEEVEVEARNLGARTGALSLAQGAIRHVEVGDITTEEQQWEETHIF